MPAKVDVVLGLRRLNRVIDHEPGDMTSSVEAGLALADHSEKWRLRQNAHPISEFLAPFFFVLLGTQVNLRTFSQPGLFLTVGVLCLLAIVSKFVGCGLGSLSMGWKDAARIGVGMVPRG